MVWQTYRNLDVITFPRINRNSKMPPISGKLYQKVLRVHYTPLEWNSPHIPSPQLPHPEDYGWKWDNQHQMYDAIMPTLLPAPEFIIKLTVCRCKTGCNTN